MDNQSYSLSKFGGSYTQGFQTCPFSLGEFSLSRGSRFWGAGNSPSSAFDPRQPILSKILISSSFPYSCIHFMCKPFTAAHFYVWVFYLDIFVSRIHCYVSILRVRNDQRKAVDKITTHIICSIALFQKNISFTRWSRKVLSVQTGHTQYGEAQRNCKDSELIYSNHTYETRC